jgi:hypothetical protein
MKHLGKKTALITQSNYIPWKGYFDAIAQADVFVVYDDVQYTRRDWRNRNRIKTQHGLHWLSIPIEVKGKFNQRISETKIASANWHDEHWRTIRSCYIKAAKFKEVEAVLTELYAGANATYLTEVNLHFIRGICKYLGINTEIVMSSDFALTEGKTQRLVDICSAIGATHYITGPAAKEYLEESRFNEAGISVGYLDYSGYREYSQPYPPFEHGVSIIDVICANGTNARQYLKY